MIERLKNFARGVGVVEPICVRVPQQKYGRRHPEKVASSLAPTGRVR